VQISRRAKTAFLIEHPAAFAYLLGWELGQHVVEYEIFLFRPNVASDVAWERLVPSMVDGSLIPATVMKAYGYTKRPEVLDTDGWLAPAYRVAYSWNEKSDPDKVRQFIRRGGSVAVVTSRRKGAASDWSWSSWRPKAVIDADLTDEWIFQRGVIGDLSAKGRARKLIGKSGFVVSVNISTKRGAA
jgi:hypothetical protein